MEKRLSTKAVLTSATLMAALLAGCDGQPATAASATPNQPASSQPATPTTPNQPATSAMPEVNDENCKDENIGKIRDKATQRAFADLCFTRGDFKPSPKREW